MERTFIRASAIPVIAIAVAVSASVTVVAAERQEVDPAQLARGARAWAENCGRCHNLRDPAELSDKNWDVAVDHMRVRIPLNGQTARDIKAYLKASNR